MIFMKNLEEFYTQKVKGFDKDNDELNQKLFSFNKKKQRLKS